MKTPDFKTWVEIDKKAALHNVKTIRSILKKKTRLYAVVKSNAYGHGLREFSLVVKDKVDGFCVDSVYEGETLRSVGIKKPILVLGPTLSKDEIKLGAVNNIEVTVSTFEALKQIINAKDKPAFHIKVDTGMHRQGFFPKDIKKVIEIIKDNELSGRLKGVYTHFASAKDITYQDYSNKQIEEFKKVQDIFKRFGLGKTLFHTSATAGALLYPHIQYDIARSGIGLYGYFPSQEASTQHPITLKKELKLKKVLSWKAKISEVKKLKKGDYVGYDLSERVKDDTTVAIIPIGYWHGIRRSLSHKGRVLIKGELCKILGRVSMDLIVVKCGKNTKVGDIATFIGEDKGKIITAENMAEITDSFYDSYYETLTQINPLIKRVVV